MLAGIICILLSKNYQFTCKRHIHFKHIKHFYLKIPLLTEGIISILENTHDLFDMMFYTKPHTFHAVSKNMKIMTRFYQQYHYRMGSILKKYVVKFKCISDQRTLLDLRPSRLQLEVPQLS